MNVNKKRIEFRTKESSNKKALNADSSLDSVRSDMSFERNAPYDRLLNSNIDTTSLKDKHYRYLKRYNLGPRGIALNAPFEKDEYADELRNLDDKSNVRS